MLITVLAAGLLLAQAAAPAAPAPAAGERTTVSEVKTAKPKKAKMICEQEKSADSFISRRVCRTPEEVEAQRRASRDAAKATQDFYTECRGRSC